MNLSNLPRYGSAFSSPHRTNNAGASSPIQGLHVGSPIRGGHPGTRCVWEEDHRRLPNFAKVSDFPDRNLHFDDQAAVPPGYGFETPRRWNNVATSISVPDATTDFLLHHRTSPTSAMEFERASVPALACARAEHQMATLYHVGNEFDVRDPEVSSSVASRRNAHQDHQGFIAADRFGVNARNDHSENHGRAAALDADGHHPTPQNLRDNPERQAKIKTELCQFYIDERECPWGINCNFAHGEHELKFRYSTLLLMESSGQIANAYTYLCRPCLTFVSTGACPFGRRCACIHDPRAQGPIEYPSWLPMATSKTNAQIIVDPLAAHRESATHQENPLVPQTIWQHCRPSLKESKYSNAGNRVKFEDTYKLICNTGIPVFLGINERSPGQFWLQKLSELQKLCIAEHFRANQDIDFLFSPSHSLRGELCMILQTRYFHLGDVNANVTKSHIVQEITWDEYKARITPWSHGPYSPLKVVVGHEVAFAPKGEPSCNFSVWFDEEPVKLEQTQIKRSRRIKQKNKTNIKKGHTRPNANGALIVRTSPVDFRSGSPDFEPFVYMVPAEDNAESNRLIDDIIEHRIDSIIYAMNASGARDEQTKLTARKQQLQKSFKVLESFHELWAWPRREGLDRITYSTQAPPGNAITYSPTPKKLDRNNEGLYDIGDLWQGFVENIPRSSDGEVKERYQRLPVFHSIGLRSEGRPLPRLPHFDEDGIKNTWKQLLLGQSGEWATARELYETKMRGSAPARNLPLSTIPFVQN